MHPILRNILAVIIGVFVGMAVNMGLINLGIKLVPLPDGATLENMAEYMHQFEFKNFIFPFLAHALGTLAGAFTAAKIAASHQMKFAIGIGFFFLLGGIAMINMLPDSPMWFNVLDLVGAYLPMGWLGAKLAGSGTNNKL